MTLDLEKLDTLTEQLPPINEDSFIRMEESSALFKAENGTILGWKLIKELGFAVHKWFISKGTSMGVHFHEGSIESITVCKGEMIIDIKGGKVVLKELDSLKIPSGTIHNAICNEDTWAITITKPPAKGFPE